MIKAECCSVAVKEEGRGAREPTAVWELPNIVPPVKTATLS